MSHSAGGSGGDWGIGGGGEGGGGVGGSQALENVANLYLLKALILPFWSFKKTNLKSCDSGNYWRLQRKLRLRQHKQ